MTYYSEDPLNNDSEEDKLEKNKILSSFFYSGLFVLILWIVQFTQWTIDKDISTYGILPGKVEGLIGILTAPLIHADFSHLVSNSVTLFFLLFGIFYFYRTSVVKIFFIIYIVHGLLVWLFARQSYHIGASGLLYGFAGFLFFSGLFRKDKRSMALSLLIVFLYGGLVWGVLPTDPKISFESHLSGALVGIICAFIFRKNDPPQKYDWEEEDYEEDAGDEDEPEEEAEAKIDDDAEPEDFRRS